METRLEQSKKIFQEFVKNFDIATKTKEIYTNEDTFYEFMQFFYNTLYDSMHNYIENNKDKETNELAKVYCKFIKDKILVVCKHKIEKIAKFEDSQEKRVLLNKWLLLEDDFFALASFRDIKMFALYIERGNPKKIWRDTIDIFEGFFYYAQSMIFGEGLTKIRASYFPGAGKTYALNLISAFWFGYDNEMSILRITYSDDLCKTFVRQIGEIIDSKQYRKVFPKFNKGEGWGNLDLYDTFSVATGFKFSFSKVDNFYSSTRGGQITGKRCKALITDDLLKGFEEAYDLKVQNSMESKYDTDWNSRSDGDTQLEIHAGTMWGEQDLLNRLEVRERKRHKLIPDNKYKYTRLSIDNYGNVKAVFIGVPILDYDTDESTCPKRYSTQVMREKRMDFKDKALFESVYQQRPQPQEGLIFNYKILSQYNKDTIPKEILNNQCECVAFLDPARKGRDYCAMGIFKRYEIEPEKFSRWYLVDCINKQDTVENLMNRIINKIILHKVDIFAYENNTDTNLKLVIKSALKDANYQDRVKIKDFYSYDNKEMRISNARNGIKFEIVYPEENMYSINSEMGIGMYYLTTYTFEKKPDYDDFPDMLSQFVKNFCEKSQNNTVQVLSRKNFAF